MTSCPDTLGDVSHDPLLESSVLFVDNDEGELSFDPLWLFVASDLADVAGDAEADDVAVELRNPESWILLSPETSDG